MSNGPEKSNDEAQKFTEPPCPRCGEELEPTNWGENNSFIDAENVAQLAKYGAPMLCESCGYGFTVTFKVDEIVEILHPVHCPHDTWVASDGSHFNWCMINEGHVCDFCTEQLSADDHKDHKVIEGGIKTNVGFDIAATS